MITSERGLGLKLKKVCLDEMMEKTGVFAYCSFNMELSTLTVVNCEEPTETISITAPFGFSDIKGCTVAQSVGAAETYARRYLYQALFDIAESDAMESVTAKPQKLSREKQLLNKLKDPKRVEDCRKWIWTKYNCDLDDLEDEQFDYVMGVCK